MLTGVEIPATERLRRPEALLDRLDKGQLRRPCLEGRQREVLVGQSAQIRPLIKMLLALDLHSEEFGRLTAAYSSAREPRKPVSDPVYREVTRSVDIPPTATGSAIRHD